MSLIFYLKRKKCFQLWNYNPFSPFGPVIERHGNNPFLSEEPVDALVSGHFQNSPWITSVTAAEGLFPAAGWLYFLIIFFRFNYEKSNLFILIFILQYSIYS